MVLEPVFIAGRAHFFQSTAPHTGGEFASLPSQSDGQADDAPYHSEANRLGPAVGATGETGPDERCARADRGQSEGAAGRFAKRIGQRLSVKMRVSAGT